MLSDQLKSAINQKISDYIKSPVKIDSVSPVSGGSINQSYCLSTNEGKFFIKTNSASRYPGMFEAETRGLQLLSETNTLYIPNVIDWGQSGDDAFLLLEFVDSNNPDPNFWLKFGKQLAQMHQNSSDYFGLDHDNYIGSLPQKNDKKNNWILFFIEERMEFQARMARDAGKIGGDTIRSLERLYQNLGSVFPEEPPALVHGDLWSGNFTHGPHGEPCILDPAVYFGHREMDIGMSKLFGGFATEFYKSYNEEYPLEKDWEKRIDVANLYPLMVHVNLFGGGYISQVHSTLRKFT